MSRARLDKVKIYIVVSLSVILLISMYYRIIRPRISSGRIIALAAQPEEKGIDIPEIKRNEPADFKMLKNNPIDRIMNETVRDVFIPALTLKKEKEQTENKPPVPPQKETGLNLRGIIKGKRNAVAIIGTKFLKENEYMGEYLIKEINEKSVILEHSGKKIKLELKKK